MWWACGIQGAHVPCLELLQVVCAGLAPEQEVSLPGILCLLGKGSEKTDEYLMTL